MNNKIVNHDAAFRTRRYPPVKIIQVISKRRTRRVNSAAIRCPGRAMKISRFCLVQPCARSYCSSTALTRPSILNNYSTRCFRSLNRVRIIYIYMYNRIKRARCLCRPISVRVKFSGKTRRKYALLIFFRITCRNGPARNTNGTTAIVTRSCLTFVYDELFIYLI